MNLTPDFAFGKRASPGRQEYPIILESGFSQSPRSLETVAQMHLTRPEVEGLFASNFTLVPLETLPDLVAPATLADFEAATTLHLGPIRYGDHQWTPIPTEDSPATMQSWSITPNATAPLPLHNQSEIIDVLRMLAHVVIGKGPFDVIYTANHPFNIDWDDFNADVHRRLVSDAYTRYWAWFHPTLPSSSGPTIENFKAGTTLTRLLEDYHSELEDSDSDSKPSSSKKVKLEKSTV
ncbi:hypothetical protein C8R44DRAFT_989902 [Mycena epipterygia]|nr:hypothetical protein C8R44DRAFT_989902 [Mycena epipterygia]